MVSYAVLVTVKRASSVPEDLLHAVWRYIYMGSVSD